MDIGKEMLRQYLATVAVNLGLLNQEVADALTRYDRDMFVRLLERRKEHLQSESQSDTAFFPPEYYADGIATVSAALKNLDSILSKTA
jgi:hypothetical protein